MRNSPILDLDPISVDSKSPVPVYLQVEQDIRRQLLNGQITGPMRLPRETEIARLYGISRMSVRNALEQLEHAGLIRRTHGVGTVITVCAGQVQVRISLMSALRDQLAAQGRTPSVRVLQREVIRASSTLAEQLEIEPEAPVFLFNRLISTDGRPVVLIRSWVPLTRFPGLDSADLPDHSLWQALARDYGCEIRSCRRNVELIEVSMTDALPLQLRDAERTTFVSGLSRDGDGRAVELAHTTWAPGTRLAFDDKI